MTDTPGDPAHLVPANRVLRRSRRTWRVLFFVALAVAVIAIAGRFALEGGAPGDRIARVTIAGTITTDRERLKVLTDLADNAAVKAVIVSINSPGGTTAGGEELYEALSTLRKTKPVVATIDELGASAAYMTAIAADRIFARRLSIVGSIGVLYQHVDAGKLLSTIGIALDKVSTGPLKAEPDLNEPMQGEVRASLQALVNDSFVWFVDIVSERRGLSRPETLALADGRIITGRKGIETRLIDAIGGEAEAVAWLESDKQVPADLPVVDYFPRPEAGWGGITRWLGRSAAEVVRSGVGEAMSLDGLVSLWHAQQPM
ncbi:MAG: signal peptide peptidase SppA [Devosia sp.]|uniref:signal peptide peptidase SppA n=1 Tax=Devosia sp. TaxID=1871048 RepID=UPI001ACA4157|nr:signal peptide peptidase SppA [Devosia sp.]MBN9317539.1 signal peptide peptidase SppA [Devosia sp.]